MTGISIDIFAKKAESSFLEKPFEPLSGVLIHESARVDLPIVPQV